MISKVYTFFFTFIIIIGSVLRLIWIEDMEWKYDEWWMYTHAMLAPLEGIWQSVGMKSGAGIINPGLSVWVFSMIGYFVETPLGMGRGVQVLSIMTLVGFVIFTRKSLKGEQQQQWYWALALLAVNPLYIIFSRKIWAQDVLPIFCLLFIIGHFYREKKWGAFIWGMVGAMLGQIHMSGFFFAFGLFILSTFRDYKRKVKWQSSFWFLGSVIGSIGLIPWIHEMIYHREASSTSWENLYKFDFYIYGFIDPLGFCDYVLLQKNALITLSDSGTISEESTILGFKALSIRTSTERPEAIDHGNIILGGITTENIINSINITLGLKDQPDPPVEYLKKDNSNTVLKLIQSYTPIINRETWRK